VLPNDEEFKTFYEVEQKDYFDTKDIKIKKLSLQEIIINKLAKYKDNISFGDSYLSNFISKYFKSLITYSKDGKPCEPYCNKDDFLAKIDSEIIIKKQKELLNVFKMDKK
jgi:hypothetical protein